jgi:hypothetical protein
VQAGDHGHWRRSRTPRTRHSEHKAPDRRQRVPVNRSNVDYTAGLASGAIDVHPRHVGDDSRPDGWRPPHIAAGRDFMIPPLDDAEPSARTASASARVRRFASISGWRVRFPICLHPIGAVERLPKRSYLSSDVEASSPAGFYCACPTG